MIRSHTPRYSALRALLVLALGASASAALAAGTITRNFNSAAELSEWGINFGTGTVTHDPSNGVDGSGCMKVTLSAANAANKEVAPMWTIPDGPFTSSDYLVLEYDLYIDPSSGTDASTEQKFFNLQEVFSDSGWSWDNHWVGAVGISYAGAWTHMTVPVPNNGKKYFRIILAMQGTAPYTADVVALIDNVTLKVLPNPLILENGTDDTIGWSPETWATSATVERVTTEDAGGGYTPLGSLKITPDFTTGWQQSWIIHNFPAFDPRRWTYIEADVKVDASLSVPHTDGSFGGFGFNVRESSWADAQTATVPMDSSWAGVWKHVKLPLPGRSSAGPLDIILNGNHGGPITVYVDNIVLTKPIEQPKVGLRKAGPSGVEITMGDSYQWERQSLVTPAEAFPLGVLWAYQQFPVTYSFTLGGFPSQASAPGLEAHMYLVNGDSQGGANNQNGGSPDWGASDVLIFRIQNEAAGVECSIHWKTNLPDANPLGDAMYHPLSVDGPTANGTWTLTFSDPTNAVVTGPGITATNFTLPAEAVMNNFYSFNSYVQWGIFKNDWENKGVNSFASGTFTEVKFTGSTYPIDDKFTGATLTNKYPWRTTSSTGVTYVPPGTAWWVNWTLPADNYTMQSAPTLAGPWGDAGATNTLQRGAMMYAPVHSSALPPGNATFFRLAKPQ